MRQEPEQDNLQDKTPPMGVLPLKTIPNTGKAFDATTESGLLDTLDFRLIAEADNSTTNIDHFPFKIGSNPHSHLCIDDAQVTGEHALILKVRNALVLTNEHAHTNVYVNRHRVKRVLLQDGDEISIAAQHFILRVQARADADTHTQLPTETDAASTTADASTDTARQAQQGGAKRKLSNNRRLGLFTLLVGLIALLGILVYPQYQDRQQAARVFTLAQKTQANDTDNKAESVINDKHSNTADAGTTGTEETINSELAKGQQTQSQNPSQSQSTNESQAQTPVVADNSELESLAKASTKQSKTTAGAKPHAQDNSAPSKKDATPKRSKRLLQVQQLSQQQLQQALEPFFTGDYQASQRALQTFADNRRHHAEYRLQARQHLKHITALNSHYQSGQQAMRKQNSESAFSHWEQLLKEHQRIFPDKPGHYTDEIREKLAAEYERRGNLAYAADAGQSAYQYWKKALAIRPKASTQQSLELMDGEIQRLYRTGYRYETVNISRSIEYWQTLLNKAPADHPYYIKAAAKLKWYQNKQ